MTRTTFLLIALMLPLVLAGCDQSSSSGGVAVIEMDRVVEELGRREAIEQDLRTQAQAIDQEVQTLSDQLNAEFQAARERAGEELTPEDQQRLQQIGQQLMLQLDRARQEAGNKKTQISRDAIQKFRDEVKPFAQQVATEQGLTMVLVNSEMILLRDDAVDITDAVIALMK